MFWSSCCLTSAGSVSEAQGSTLTSLYLVMSTSNVPAIFADAGKSQGRVESERGTRRRLGRHAHGSKRRKEAESTRHFFTGRPGQPRRAGFPGAHRTAGQTHSADTGVAISAPARRAPHAPPHLSSMAADTRSRGCTRIRLPDFRGSGMSEPKVSPPLQLYAHIFRKISSFGKMTFFWYCF